MRLKIAIAAGLSFAVAACMTATPTPSTFQPITLATLPPGVTVPALQGRFVFAPGDGRLMIQDANAKDARLIFEPKDGTYADYPVFSPDGKQIAFSTTSLEPDGSVRHSIRLMDADGANARQLYAPDDPKVWVTQPAWSHDGGQVFFTQISPAAPGGERAEIARVDIAGGASERLLTNAREPSLSPDGKKIAYYQFDLKTYASSLWLANLDGSEAKMLIDTETFAALQSARFSPDSQWMVFAASGAPNRKLPGMTRVEQREKGACYLALLHSCLISRAHAHGLPWDLWLVNLDATKFERVTEVGADNPFPAWSSDGKFIAFYELTGIYVVDRAKKIVYQLSSLGGTGGFDWR